MVEKTERLAEPKLIVAQLLSAAQWLRGAGSQAGITIPVDVDQAVVDAIQFLAGNP